MDLKKEIKLSDLVPKRKPKEPKPETDEAPKEKKPKKPKTPLLKKDLSFKRKPKAKREPVEEDEQPKKKRSKRAPRDGAKTKRAKKLVGLKIGGSQLAAARIVNNGSPELVQVACEKAGIRLAGIDLEAFALLRALATPPEDKTATADAAIVVVAIGHDRSTFAVSDGRVCEFTRVLDWGGGTLDVAIARELNSTPSEAEPFKRELSLAVDNVPEGLTAEQAATAREAVRRQLQGFARELVSSLQFYQNQPGSLGIGEIVITGGTAHLQGLGDELQKLIGVRVTVGDPLTRVKLGKKLKETEQVGSLAVAIGLGIED